MRRRQHIGAVSAAERVDFRVREAARVIVAPHRREEDEERAFVGEVIVFMSCPCVVSFPLLHHGASTHT